MSQSREEQGRYAPASRRGETVENPRGLPALLPCEAFVQQCQHLGDVELDVFEIQIVLVILLHLEQVVELQIELEETPVAT